MRLEVFDSKTRNRIGMINTYTFVQYIDKFIGIGTFSMKVPFNENNLKLLKCGNYILFDDNIMGVIKYRRKETDESSNFEIKGFLIKHFLTYRSFLKTYKISKQGIFDAISGMFKDCFKNYDAYERAVHYMAWSTDLKDKKYPDASITTQFIGDTLEEAMNEVLANYNLGVDLLPYIVDIKDGSDVNLQYILLDIIVPTDRSVGNEEGNTPVVFSMSLNNLAREEYEEDESDYCNTLFIAGEGEEDKRRTLDLSSKSVSGLDRIELYIDARDIQSEDQENPEPDETYLQRLFVRGMKKKQEHLKYENVTGTLVNGNIKYKYKKDFFKGDYVSIKDDQLGITAKVQITEVTVSNSGTGEIIDLTFGYSKSIMKEVYGGK